jgi:DNA-directed RNA polymerase subunit N (RpoN/RPB10)
MRLAEYQKVFDSCEYETNPVLFAISEDTKVDLRKVFEALGVNMMCCRSHLATQVEIKELY